MPTLSGPSGGGISFFAPQQKKSDIIELFKSSAKWIHQTVCPFFFSSGEPLSVFCAGRFNEKYFHFLFCRH